MSSFTSVFVSNGRVSDRGVLEYTDFYDKLQTGCLKTPESSDVKGSKLPYVFIGEEVFCLRKKPYSVQQLTRERNILNCRLCRARRIIENVFGNLVARFGIFKTHINIKLDNI
jgi:hypothetical protein